MYVIPTVTTIGALVSAIIAFTPVLKDFFNKQSRDRKIGTIVVLSFAVGIGVFIHDNPSPSAIEFIRSLTADSIIQLAINILFALAGTQLQHYFVNTPLSSQPE